jgi:plastocyanin
MEGFSPNPILASKGIHVRKSVLAFGVVVCLATGLLLIGQAPPGTSMDRIGFPKNYQTTYKKMYTLDNNQNRQIRVIWANDVAQTVNPNQPWNFPYGSILLFESYAPQLDANGDPVLSDSGRFVPTDLQTVFVMKKDQGFGAEYGPVRNGEWEYVSYNPDGSYATAPAGSGACALCHLQASSASLTSNLPPSNAVNDYVFRVDQMFAGGSGAMPGGVMQNYLFVPNTIHVKAGTTLTIYNDDDVVHTISANDGSFFSGFMGKGGSYTMKFDQPGEVAIHCTLHNRMRGTIIVDPPGASASTTTSSYGHGAGAVLPLR